MTFIWSEVVFLKTWWYAATPSKRKALRDLVANGRLEITTGGWVMADEATTHLYALVDQLIEGHQWLNTHLGVQPKFGWSVDVFGHSSTQAQLLSLSGIHATVIQRIHYAWKEWFAHKQYGDFVWVPNWKDINHKGILTHNQPFKLYTTRSCGPNEFICAQFDFRMTHEDYPNIVDENTIKLFTGQLIEQYKRSGSLFKHNVVLMPLGCDFCYNEATDWDLIYENYNKIIRYVKQNQGNKIDIEFGTVKTYFQEMLRRGTTMPTLKGDFFVYADIDASGIPNYWSGYFTTRPYFKILDRYLEAKLRSTEILYAMALNCYDEYGSEQLDIFTQDFNKIIQTRRTLALFQHHDSITGTSKSHVMNDNAMRILEAIYEITEVQRRSVRALLFPNDFVVDLSEKNVWRDLGKIIQEHVFYNEDISMKKLIFFNPLAQRRIQFVKVLSNSVNFKIRHHVNKIDIPIQISPVWEYFKQKTNVSIPPDKFELGFLLDLPPTSLTTYELYHSIISLNLPVIYSNANFSRKNIKFVVKKFFLNDIYMDNSKYILRFDKDSGLLQTIHDKIKEKTVKCIMEIGAYKSAEFLSGVYVFYPEKDKYVSTKDVLKQYQPIIHLVRGQIYNQLTVIYNNFFSVIVRLYNTNSYLSDAIHIENSVDFGGYERFLDTELYMRFKTDIQNSDPPIIFTDCNNFHMQKRTYAEDATIAGNYFPMTVMAYIEDTQSRLSLLSNHAQGVASLEQGNLEVMLDRRITYNDNKGVNEGLVDNLKIINEFWLLLEHFTPIHQFQYLKRDSEVSKPSMFANHMSNILNYPFSMFSIAENDLYKRMPVIQLLQDCFPCDVHVVNLRVQPKFRFSQRFSKNAFLILHRQGYTCDLESSYVCNNLEFKNNCAFQAIKVIKIVNMTLTGLRNISQPFTNFSLMYLPPMSIQTYNVTFS
ncbi:alpha-mannosidase [Holotrichia oblita]|uniref:Alpha-mannosidase n=1 Tax=Holotrichia oblita TaxID=644536 RepID=A0ACB9TEH7_HOLOL|nr:alpha-mannosidase [Holotrichia oblita]